MKKQNTNKKQRMQYLMQRQKIRHAHVCMTWQDGAMQLSNLIGIGILAIKYRFKLFIYPTYKMLLAWQHQAWRATSKLNGIGTSIK